jgi:hypothetical protein
MSTACTFIAVNAMKEVPTTKIAMKRASVCILSSQSNSHAYQVLATIDTIDDTARNSSSNLMVKAHHFG